MLLLHIWIKKSKKSADDLKVKLLHSDIVVLPLKNLNNPKDLVKLNICSIQTQGGSAQAGSKLYWRFQAVLARLKLIVH